MVKISYQVTVYKKNICFNNFYDDLFDTMKYIINDIH